MAAVAPLHPISLSDIPPSALESARSVLPSHRLSRICRHKCTHRNSYAAEIDRLLEGQNSTGAGPTSLGRDDVLRLILAVQCNAFYSGFYLHCSMFNHACNPK